MKIWILKRDDHGYDEYDGKVIVAKNAKRAREIANENTGDEGRIWTDAALVSCEEIKATEEGEVLGSFNAG